MRSAALAVLLVACSNESSPPGPGTACGAGTTQQGTTCVPSTLACGAGTHEETGVCVPGTTSSARYDLRVAPTIRADGFTTVDVTVFGTNPDGTPSHEAVVFTADRATAGAVVSPNVVLGTLGGSTTFRPCLGTTAGCTGPVQFSVALASAPQTPVAHADAMVVAPPAVGSIAPCMTGGNVLHEEAMDFGFTGTHHVTTNFDPRGSANRARIQAYDTMPHDVEFTTAQLGIPLLTTTYEGAQRIGYAGPYQPVLDTGMYPCVPVGRFQIHSFTYDAQIDKVTELTASFEQYCEPTPPQTRPTKTITGCVHYQQ